MQGQLKTQQLVTVMRPRFAVDGQSTPRLGEDLLRLEATEDEDGMARLVAVFLNWGRRTDSSEPGFVYFDGEAFDLGREILVEAGDEENAATIFRGVITAVEGDYPELRPPEIRICAEDRLQWQRMRQRTRYFEQLSDTDFAAQIAGDHGLSPDVDAEAPTYAEFWQVNQSDLSFLRERSQRVDARIAADEGKLVFRPRREVSGAPVKLTRENELLRFRVAADLSHQRTEVRVHGYSVEDKQGIHEVAGADEVRSEAANRVLRRHTDLGDLGLQAFNLVGLHERLQRFGVSLVIFSPFGHADRFDVELHRLGDGLVEVTRVGSAHDLPAQGRVRHHRGALGDLLQGFEILANTLGRDLANEVPDAGLRRYDVGLVASIRDDVV